MRTGNPEEELEKTASRLLAAIEESGNFSYATCNVIGEIIAEKARELGLVPYGHTVNNISTNQKKSPLPKGFGLRVLKKRLKHSHKEYLSPGKEEGILNITGEYMPLVERYCTTHGIKLKE